MPKIIEMIYENGAFKPPKKVDLPEKTMLRLEIEDLEDLLKEFC